jgi:hypothetical protein
MHAATPSRSRLGIGIAIMGIMNKKTLELAKNNAECARLARPIGSGFRYACLTLADTHLHAITALKALDVTLSDITHTISEPHVARAKLDWWRGALHEATEQNTAAHPILAALLASVDTPTLKKLVPHLEARLGSALLELDYQGFETPADLSFYLDARGGAQFALYCALLPIAPCNTGSIVCNFSAEIAHTALSTCRPSVWPRTSSARRICTTPMPHNYSLPCCNKN